MQNIRFRQGVTDFLGRVVRNLTRVSRHCHHQITLALNPERPLDQMHDLVFFDPIRMPAQDSVHVFRILNLLLSRTQSQSHRQAIDAVRLDDLQGVSRESLQAEWRGVFKLHPVRDGGPLRVS